MNFPIFKAEYDVLREENFLIIRKLSAYAYHKASFSPIIFLSNLKRQMGEQDRLFAQRDFQVTQTLH